MPGDPTLVAMLGEPRAREELEELARLAAPEPAALGRLVADPIRRPGAEELAVRLRLRRTGPALRLVVAPIRAQPVAEAGSEPVTQIP